MLFLPKRPYVSAHNKLVVGKQCHQTCLCNSEHGAFYPEELPTKERLKALLALHSLEEGCGDHSFLMDM